MHLDENPLFREAIVPWYDSTAAYLATLVVMEGIFIFGIVGFWAAGEMPAFRRYAWVPAVLAGMSLGIIISISLRLILRYARRRKKQRARSSALAPAKRL